MKKPKRVELGFMLKMLLAMPTMRKYGKISCVKFVNSFKHPAIRRLFSFITDDYAATAIVSTLATLDSGDGGYPKGGSLPMVHRMAKTFKDIRDKLMLNTHVKKVNVENGRITGFAMERGTLVADAVIVTQETIAVLDKLFDVQPDDAWLKTVLDTTKPAVYTFVSIEVRVELCNNIFPEWKREAPITYAEQTIHVLSFNSFRSYASEGGTALMMGIYDFWKKAKDEGEVRGGKASPKRAVHSRSTE